MTNDEKSAAAEPKKSTRRDIAGNIPYTSSPGVFKKALDGIIETERPETFNANFLETVLSLSGGSARVVPPLLKKMGFLGTDGSPTERYADFKTESGRSQAAYEGLKSAFPDIFRKNELAHKADEAKVKDAIISITGLKSSDKIVGYMYSTFEAIRSYVSDNLGSRSETPEVSPDGTQQKSGTGGELRHVGLAYNINIVVPETSDVKVLNAIFRAVKENLLS